VGARRVAQDAGRGLESVHEMADRIWNSREQGLDFGRLYEELRGLGDGRSANLEQVED
jgi:hypothetical protein